MINVPNRRLSDMVKEALEQAVNQDRKEIAEERRLLFEKVLKQDAAYPNDRRKSHCH